MIVMTTAAVLVLALSLYWQRQRGTRFESQTTLEAMRRQNDEITLQLIDMQRRLSYALRYIADLSAVLAENGIQPPSMPLELAPTRAQQFPSVVLHQLMVRVFDMDELTELALEADIPPESYSGGTVSARARSLIQYAERHGVLSELLDACRKARPREMWPSSWD